MESRYEYVSRIEFYCLEINNSFHQVCYLYNELSFALKQRLCREIKYIIKVTIVSINATG